MMKFSGNLKLALLSVTAFIAFTFFGTPNALAVVQFDQNITPEVIFGSGNDNGSFTTDRQNGVEIGLRGKLRFNAANLPENTFNSNSDGTYSFAARNAVGFGFDLPPNNTPEWNFEWSVNTDFDETSGLNLKDLTYEIGLDFDPGAGTNFLVFDNITPAPPAVPFYDHAIGDNTTANGGGTVAGDAGTYQTLLNDNNVAQNSWSYEFFDNDPPFTEFDPTVDGSYDIYLLARNAAGEVVAKAEIQIIVGDGAPVEESRLDHYQCYDVKKSSRLDSHPKVSLNDQFGFRDEVKVSRRVASYCTPVDKNGEGIFDPDTTLACYWIKEKRQRQEVVLENQFGEHTIVLKKSKLLCVPSTQLSTRPLEKPGHHGHRKHHWHYKKHRH